MHLAGCIQCTTVKTFSCTKLPAMMEIARTYEAEIDRLVFLTEAVSIRTTTLEKPDICSE